MGGSAFLKAGHDGPALNVPRLLPEQYALLKQQCHSILCEQFEVVLTPPEAPEKPDYGDLDFLVTNPNHVDRDKISAALGARRVFSHGPTTSYAVPWPETFRHKSGDDGDHYAQVDVHICSKETLEWTCFMQAYGDMWQILGYMIRPFGLSPDDFGLNVRIPEIEPSNKRKSKILLTSEPRKVMGFLSLDVERYEQGFTTQNALFEWIAQSRFFRVEAFTFSRPETHNDRARLKKRVMFCSFVEEWAPQRLGVVREVSDLSPQSTKGVTQAVTEHGEKNEIVLRIRAQVLQDALNLFDQRSTYDDLLRNHHAIELEKNFWQKIPPLLPVTGDSLGRAIRGLKRFVKFAPGGVPELQDTAELDDAKYAQWTRDSAWSEDKLLAWIDTHWQEASRLEKERMMTAQTLREKS